MKYNLDNYDETYNDKIISPAKILGINQCIYEIIEEEKKGKLHILYSNIVKNMEIIITFLI